MSRRRALPVLPGDRRIPYLFKTFNHWLVTQGRKYLAGAPQMEAEYVKPGNTGIVCRILYIPPGIPHDVYSPVIKGKKTGGFLPDFFVTPSLSEKKRSIKTAAYRQSTPMTIQHLYRFRRLSRTRCLTRSQSKTMMSHLCCCCRVKAEKGS